MEFAVRLWATKMRPSTSPSSARSLWLIFLLMAVVVPAVLWIYRSRVPTNVAYVSEEDGAISVLDLKTLSVFRRVQPQDVAPRGLAVTADGRYLITSNKNTKDAAVFSTPELRLVRRLDLGSSPEFLKLNPSGDRIFATFEPSSAGGPGRPPAIGATDDETNGPPAHHSREKADPAAKQVIADFGSIYVRLPSGYFGTIHGANHFTFSDQILLKSRLVVSALMAVRVFGHLEPRRGLSMTTDYVHTFFDVYLKGAPPSQLAGLAAKYPEVQTESH